jgi:hypothetical protein
MNFEILAEENSITLCSPLPSMPAQFESLLRTNNLVAETGANMLKTEALSSQQEVAR